MALPSATCLLQVLSNCPTSLDTTYCPRPCLYDITDFPDSVTHYLFANTLCHSSGHCPCSPSWQIALNLYIKLREVSLLLMAIFRLRLLLLQRHCFFVPCPLGGWYVYFNAHGYCQKSHKAIFIFKHQNYNRNVTLEILRQLLLTSLLPNIKVPSSLRDRITRLSILFLLLPASCLALSIANRLASITESLNFL